MTNNLIETFSNQKNIPEVIGEYYFNFTKNCEDGDFQLRYDGDENGFFTITLYNRGVDIPDNLEDPIMLSEIEECINAIFEMEDQNCYQNVKLLMNEPYFFENDKEPKFLSAVFKYDRYFENGESLNEVSFLFLRSDHGFFNKVRFSVSTDASEEVLEKMEAFLIDWLNYISVIGAPVN